MNWEPLLAQIRALGQSVWADHLQQEAGAWLVGHGDYQRWSAALADLPPISSLTADFDCAAITLAGECTDMNQLRQALRGLMPWRKGPFRFADVEIDTEWRSNLKWDRVRPHLAPLRGRRILDVGCGNGYYAWRMLADDPLCVIGVEPSVLFNLQFQAVQKYLGRNDIGVLPIVAEAIPEEIGCFDTVFSMGVLYHRRSPIDHLYRLKGFLAGGGELCLETLVIEGGDGQVLVPEGRYARMRNVWFIPSSAELKRWLERCGFTNVRLVDESPTQTDEQRSTEWMTFESLAECLDPANSLKTVEGYPAPRRAVVLADKPAG